MDAYAGEPHFLDHLLPIWRALPAQMRGTFYVAPFLVEHARRRRVRIKVVEPRELLAVVDEWVMVAGVRDLRRAGPQARAVFVEHGSGQWFGGEHASHAGGSRRETVGLFVNPNAPCAERNLARYPKVPSVVVGSPKLDHWHLQPPKARVDPPVVAVSFHWECRTAPETRSALPHYRRALYSLVKGPWRVIGHGHPRAQSQLQRIYSKAGIEWVADFEDVLERADVYVNDASSTLYEFASTGRPVVVLNAPWYRREVDFGLRFWTHANVGVQVDTPVALVAGIRDALEDSPLQQERREAGVAAAYAYTDGKAARRAAEAIEAVVG